MDQNISMMERIQHTDLEGVKSNITNLIIPII